MLLLKNADCYAPEHIGKRDLLICGGRMERIAPEIRLPESEYRKVCDCEGLLAFPGLMDQHVHILGGGGEQGFASRIAEISADEILSAGVTSLVGLLGADNCTRSLEALYAKAKALEAQGISAWIYSGAYELPPVTFTGSVTRDLVLIDKVIGVGEIALSDHRSSHAGLETLLKLASDTHIGGLVGGKAGVLHLHIGDGKSGLDPVRQMVSSSELPKEMFVPTHVNRNRELFAQSVEYCKAGGRIDLTAGETSGLAVPEAITRLLRAGADPANITVSSDAHGSIPGGGTAQISALTEDIVRCAREKEIGPETAFGFVTQNVAKLLKLYPRKGALREGSDADILLTDRSFRFKKLFCSGKLLKEF